MLEASDAPTIWETWPEWEAEVLFGQEYGLITSYTHSGGVGPTWTLSKHALGVYPEGPGFQKCRIEPQSGYLEWAKGVFPTVRGDIDVSWKREKDQFVLDTKLPEDLEADIILPRDSTRRQELNHDGKHYEIPRGARSVVGLRVSQATIVVTVAGGDHHFDLVAK
jgi:hypothetical protein